MFLRDVGNGAFGWFIIQLERLLGVQSDIIQLHGVDDAGGLRTLEENIWHRSTSIGKLASSSQFEVLDSDVLGKLARHLNLFLFPILHHAILRDIFILEWNQILDLVLFLLFRVWSRSMVRLWIREGVLSRSRLSLIGQAAAEPTYMRIVFVERHRIRHLMSTTSSCSHCCALTEFHWLIDFLLLLLQLLQLHLDFQLFGHLLPQILLLHLLLQLLKCQPLGALLHKLLVHLLILALQHIIVRWLLLLIKRLASEVVAVCLLLIPVTMLMVIVVPSSPCPLTFDDLVVSYDSGYLAASFIGVDLKALHLW